jgi:malate dehydrogenase (oxaloacetate-decarboxylating)
MTTRGRHQKGKASVEEMLRKAEQPSKVALKLHAFYRGKIEVVPKCPVRSHADLAIWYTPGVAEPCKKIHENKDAVFDYTNKGNSVAIVSDGSRVLGLGDLGAEAGLPVMEGKALLYKFLGGVDAYPIMLDTKSKEKIIDTCKIIAPSFGGINLEDIEKPKCFEIMDRLKNELDIPVWHDDQQGTASVVTVALVNAISYVGKKLDQVDITLVGSGAANIATARLLRIAGAREMAKAMLSSGYIQAPPQ